MSNHLKIFLIDLYLLLASFIGLGFASGKEISHFFCMSKNLCIISIMVFIVTFSYFFNIIKKFQIENNIKNLNEFNDFLFKKYKKTIKIFLFIIYLISSACMLAGFNTIINSIFNIKYSIFSLIIVFFAFFILIGGINRIKSFFNKLIPFMLIIILINLIVNNYFSINLINNYLNNINFNFLNKKEIFFSAIYPIIFFGSNVILAFNAIIIAKTNRKKLSIFSSLILLIFLILGGFSICVNSFQTSMPFLELSKNVSKIFYVVYLLIIIFSLFSSLIISSNNMIILTNKKDKFTIILILLLIQIIAFLGFDFIVSYLYTFSGILGLIYCCIVLLKIKLIKKRK